MTTNNNKNLQALVDDINDELKQDNPDFVPVSIEDILRDEAALKIIMEALLNEFKRTN